MRAPLYRQVKKLYKTERLAVFEPRPLRHLSFVDDRVFLPKQKR